MILPPVLTGQIEHGGIGQKIDSTFEQVNRFVHRNGQDVDGNHHILIPGDTPQYQLCGLQCVELQPGEQTRIHIFVDSFWIKAVLDDGSRVNPDGSIMLYVGGQQPDARSTELTGKDCLKLLIQCSDY